MTTWWDRLKSLPLTIVLTVLIWMYAEAKFTTTQDNVRLTLKTISPLGEVELRPADSPGDAFAPRMTVLVTVEGPKNQVDRLYQDSLGVQQEEDFSALAYVPPADDLKAGGGRGVSRAQTVELLNGLRFFRQRGVTVVAATPAEVECRLAKPAATNP
jgi:hypothetical protein